MAASYPNDADGDALRRVASDGSDMTKPMDIDFAIAVPDEQAAHQIAAVAESRGYRSKPYHDDEDDSWSVYCTRTMLATYDGLLAVQAELDSLSNPFGGYSDGWGTFGNVDEN